MQCFTPRTRITPASSPTALMDSNADFDEPIGTLFSLLLASAQAAPSPAAEMRELDFSMGSDIQAKFSELGTGSQVSSCGDWNRPFYSPLYPHLDLELGPDISTISEPWSPWRETSCVP